VKVLNFRVSDQVREALDRLVDQVAESGGEMSFSEVARLAMAEGLESLKLKTAGTNHHKGIRFERWVLKQLREALPDFEFEHLRAEQGRKNPDILGPFFAYECKTGKRPSTRQALDQIMESDREGRMPVAVIRDDGGEAFVVLPLPAFLKLLKAFGVLAGFVREANK